MKILVVEDDPNLRSLWGGLLEKTGHQIRQVESEAATIEILQKQGFDLVVLDLCMNGLDAARVVAMATERNASCKLVLVTGSAVHSGDKLPDLSPAVIAAFRKPVDIEDLMAVCDLASGEDAPHPHPILEGSAVEFRP